METEQTLSPTKTYAKAGIAGVIAHATLCPVDGLAGILLKTGVLGAGATGALYQYEERLTDIVAETYEYLGVREHQAHHIAHDTIDIFATTLMIATIGYSIHRVRTQKKRQAHAHDTKEHEHPQ